MKERHTWKIIYYESSSSRLLSALKLILILLMLLSSCTSAFVRTSRSSFFRGGAIKTTMYASATPSLASPNRKRKVSKKAAAPQDPLSTAFSVVFDDEKPNILKDGNGQHSKRVASKAKSKKPSIIQSSEPTPEVFQHLSSPKAELSHVTNVAFDSLHVCENTKKAIATVMKYQFMTPVQQQSIPVVLDGKDVFVKAKTGTGKTLAFLIPAIEVLIRDRARYTDTTNNNKQESPLILVMSPTRELASQISEEAKQLCFYHKFRIVTLFGGTNMNSDVKKINQGTDIIVATPGRLLAHLQETNGFARRCGKGIRVLVLDECDRLLDMGFSRDVNKIMDHIRPSAATRRTLLFSATTSDSVKEIASKTLKSGYSTIDTVGEEVEQTHAHVPQQLLSVPQTQQVRALTKLIHDEVISNPNSHKIMVFYPTARQAAFAATLFNQAQIPVLEIHSRKSQGARTKTSDLFRTAKSAILFSSDVTARGLDYPDVTLVCQVGMTSREQYIHRLGRTARAGKSGSGVLLLATFETRAMKDELNDMPMETLQAPLLTGPASTISPWVEKVELLMLKGSVQEEAEDAWGAWLGFYNSMAKKLGWTKDNLVQASLEYALSIGLPRMPSLPKRTLSKMGLVGVAGLNMVNDTPGGRPSGGRGGATSGRGGGSVPPGRGGGGRGGPERRNKSPVPKKTSFRAR